LNAFAQMENALFADINAVQPDT